MPALGRKQNGNFSRELAISWRDKILEQSKYTDKRQIHDNGPYRDVSNIGLLERICARSK